MKIVFMGTPDFAAVSLKVLIDWAPANDAEIVAVYCQPDRPAGRGHKLHTGPVKELALAHNIPVLQPKTLKDESAVRVLASFGADVFAVAAYGLILSQNVLDLPPMGALNVHGSLLPEWRGAAPIQRAVMNGDIRTGITIQKVALKLDSGPIILQRAVGIGDDQTSGELHDELAALGGRLLAEAIERLRDGRAMLMPQDESLVSYAAKLEKPDGVLDFSARALDVHNRARGVTPWPGAQAILKRFEKGALSYSDLNVVIEKGCVMPGEEIQPGATPGTILPVKMGIIPVVCGSRLYGIKQIKPAGGKSMSAASFYNGYLRKAHMHVGMKVYFESPSPPQTP